MTSLVNYRKTGRIVMAGYAWYKFAGSVRKGSLIGSTSWGIVAVEATIGVFYPDPVATAIGGAVIKGGRAASSGWIWLMRLAMRYPAPTFTILYIALLPFGIKERQELKAKEGLIEPLGMMTFQAESIPNTERIRIPSIPTSRVF